MKTKLTNNVGNLEIKKEDTIEKMCSLSDDVVGKKCLSEGNDACGDGHIATKGEFVEILEFTHFTTIFRFNKTSGIGKEKEIFHEVKVSVGFELV